MFRGLNLLMVALFSAGAAVQVNDPDPIPWMGIYAAACAVALVRAVRGAVPMPAPLGVGVVALVWGATIVVTGPGLGVYGQMFGAWEMDSAATEEAREATGLVLIACWMAVLAWTSWSGRGTPRLRAATAASRSSRCSARGQCRRRGTRRAAAPRT